MDPRTLRAARAMTGLSQTQVAEQLGISTMTVKRAEGSGKPRPADETIRKIVELLHENGASIQVDSDGLPRFIRVPSKIHSGKATMDGYFDGMEIEFTRPIHDMSSRDLLLIDTPTKGNLSLTPIDVDGDDIIVAATTQNMSLHFRLRATSEKTAKLVYEKQHRELQKMGVWNPQLVQ